MPERKPDEAHARTPEDIKRLPTQADIMGAAARRRIGQVVHFTTMSGATGILASGAVKSRERLPKEKYLEYIYKPNAEIRKDKEWLDYVNLSIERINDWMFQSSVKWHVKDNNPWVVLSFHPRILSHPGVVFTTTNNIYPNCERAEGLSGFHKLFTDAVRGRYDRLHYRTNKSAAWPTDRQAEVLYPSELSCDHLQRIDVQHEEALDTIHGVLNGLGRKVSVCLAPEAFG